MLFDNVLLASIVTVVTPFWGFGTQHGLISSCFANTLLLIVLHKHLIMVEEFIFRRKLFWIPEHFLVFFGLVGSHIKTYIMLSYARYAIKSDYLNLIF